jgi:hypothetical protein
VSFGECLHWTYSLYEVAEDRMFAGRPRQERKKLFEDFNSRTKQGQNSQRRGLGRWLRCERLPCSRRTGAVVVTEFRVVWMVS